MAVMQQVTVDVFKTLPLDGIWELIDGELIELQPTGGESGGISADILGELSSHVRAKQLGWTFGSQTGFVLFPDRDTVRAPDAAVVLRDRLPERPKGFIPLAPDLAVEVLSPSDRMADALSKVGMYLDAGVRLVWLVDPALRSVTVFRPDAAPLTLHYGDTLDGGDVLPAFRLSLAEIFASPPS